MNQLLYKNINEVIFEIYKKKYLFLILFLIFGLNFTYSQKNLNINQYQVKLGDVYYENGAFVKALSNYEIALENNQENSLLNFKIALCFYYTNEDSLAKQIFEKSFSLDSNVDNRIYYYLARCNHLSGNFKTAIKYYTIEKENTIKQNQSHYINILNKFISECKSGEAYSKEVDNMYIVKNLGDSVNSVNSDYSFTVNNEKNQFFLTSKREGNIGTKSTEDIYFYEIKDSLRGKVENIGKPINSYNNEAVLNISNNDKILYLRVDINSGDIFWSKLDSIGWSQPQPISNMINSEFSESSLSFSVNEDTMYFVSDRKGSVGGKDIFYSVKKKTEWLNPVNLGEVINTEYDEESVFFCEDTLYFSSQGHNSIGGFDIFKTFRDNKGDWSKPMSMGVPVNSPYDDLFYTQSGEVAYISSDRYGGFGEMDIYSIKQLKPLGLNNPDSVVRLSNEISVISNILFDINMYENVKARFDLDLLSFFLMSEPDAKVLITGYTDIQGVDNYNQELSKKRANFVKQYIVSKGVSENALIVEGKGCDDPLAKNFDDNGNYLWESLKYNRRVEIKVLSQGKKRKIVVNNISIPKEYQILKDDISDQLFSIWLKSYKEPVKIENFKVDNVEEYKSYDGLFDYYYGTYKSLREAKKELIEIKRIYPNAFVVIK